MNSFSFLIAFVAACTLPIAYGSPCMGLNNLDCGSSSGSGLLGGQIISAGRMVQANSWSNNANIGTIDAGAGCNTGAAVVNALPIAASSAGCNTGAAVVNAMPIASSTGCNTGAAVVNAMPLASSSAGLNTVDAVSDCGDNAGWNTGYGSGYGSGYGAGYGTGYGSGDGYNTGYGSGYNTGYGSGYNTGIAADAGDMIAPAAEPCNEPQPPRMLVSQQRGPIVVNRPATNVVVNQPADVVRANPVVIRRPPGVVVRPIIKNVFPRPIKVQPVIVRAIRPVEKHYVKKSYEDCAGPVWSHTKVVPDC